MIVGYQEEVFPYLDLKMGQDFPAFDLHKGSKLVCHQTDMPMKAPVFQGNVRLHEHEYGLNLQVNQGHGIVTMMHPIHWMTHFYLMLQQHPDIYKINRFGWVDGIWRLTFYQPNYVIVIPVGRKLPYTTCSHSDVSLTDWIVQNNSHVHFRDA